MITELFTPNQIATASASSAITKDTEARGMKGFRIWNLSSWFYDVMDIEMMRVGMAQPWFFTQGSFERDLTYLRISSSLMLPALDLPTIPTTQRYVYIELTAEPLPYFTYGLVPGANPGGGTGSPGYSRLQDGSSTSLAAVSGANDVFPNSAGLVATIQPLAFNDGSGLFERVRNNTQITLLATAARTGSTSAATQTNYNARGLILFLNITAASGTGGLQVRKYDIDVISGSGVYSAVAPAAITAVGMYAYVFYPGASAAAVVGAGGVQVFTSAPTGRVWAAQVIHGDATGYTYSLSAGYIL